MSPIAIDSSSSQYSPVINSGDINGHDRCDALDGSSESLAATPEQAD